jgi:hypothetical protein
MDGRNIPIATAIYSINSFGGPVVYLQFRTFAPDVAGLLALGVAVLVAFRRWIDATALALVAFPWLVFGTLDQQTFGGPPTFYAVWVELVCVVAVGLVGPLLSRLKNTSEPAY